MLSAPEVAVRQAAVEMFGWLPPGFMRDTLEVLAREDLYDTISGKAIEALQRQDEQRWVGELMKEFRGDSTCRRWSLLTSIIQLGDPFLLADRKDRLWIGQILNETAEEYWEWLNSRYGELREQEIQ